MTNELMKSKYNYLTDTTELDPATLRDFVDPNRQASPQELQMLMAIVKSMDLNPFTKEVYFIKYGNQPAQIVVALKAFLKMADAHPEYNGMEAGIIYEKDGEVKRSDGAFLPRDAEILGGWATVYRKDRSYPTKIEVTFSEYDNSKIRKEGEMNAYGKPNKPNTWDDKPSVMIRKVAVVTALREAFPNELGGVYEVDEFRKMKDVTPDEEQESREEVLARKLQDIERMKQEVAEREARQRAGTAPVADSETGEVLAREMDMLEGEDF